ncbi:YdeI/OmpD-associated family protein [Formosa sp. S-31]|uniref:YdeI/OmpD-associated family protein n=1 Tax=Formosa sp. S-31 TaxID=2790949 RepID=UPI003EB7EF46
MNPEVDLYFIQGCMRCELGATPECKINNWKQEMSVLRHHILECGLTETLKWSVPCYTYNGKNILLLSAFKAYCSINFFKGALLKDAHNLLEKQGENTQVTRVLKFRNIKDVESVLDVLKQYIFEAIEIERAGVEAKKNVKEETIPLELQEVFNSDQDFKTAFYNLTPGRQRGYLLHFNSAKQSKTRSSRIEKYKGTILKGLGIHDEYRNQKK